MPSVWRELVVLPLHYFFRRRKKGANTKDAGFSAAAAAATGIEEMLGSDLFLSLVFV